MRPTFSNATDRVVYLLAQYRFIVSAALIMLGLYLGIAQPKIPSVPQWVTSILSGLLILGPPSYIGGAKIANYLHEANRVPIYHVNVVEDEIEKWLVPPQIWREKTVEGPDPYPVNGGSGWAVQEWDWQEGTETLVVRGVWLSELEDTKLLSEKEHMRSMYGKLLDSHLSLAIMRNSLREIGGDIQTRVMNRVTKSIERGTHLDKTGVKETFEAFEQDVESIGADDLPSVEEQVFEWQDDVAPREGSVSMDDVESGGEAPVATDGGDER